MRGTHGSIRSGNSEFKDNRIIVDLCLQISRSHAGLHLQLHYLGDSSLHDLKGKKLDCNWISICPGGEDHVSSIFQCRNFCYCLEDSCDLWYLRCRNWNCGSDQFDYDSRCFCSQCHEFLPHVLRDKNQVNVVCSQERMVGCVTDGAQQDVDGTINQHSPQIRLHPQNSPPDSSLLSHDPISGNHCSLRHDNQLLYWKDPFCKDLQYAPSSFLDDIRQFNRNAVVFSHHLFGWAASYIRVFLPLPDWGAAFGMDHHYLCISRVRYLQFCSPHGGDQLKTIQYRRLFSFKFDLYSGRG